MARKRLRQHCRIVSLETCSARHGVRPAADGQAHARAQLRLSSGLPRVMERRVRTVTEAAYSGIGIGDFLTGPARNW